jgi:hypothetical protein
MLRIRNSQLAAFESAAMNGFEQRLVDAVREHWPDQCARLGEELRDVVRYGIARGESHRIVSQRGLFRYVNLMFQLGRDFDADPALPSAREILHDLARTEDQRIDALVELARVRTRAASATAATVL